jgi:hypothetical protein
LCFFAFSIQHLQFAVCSLQFAVCRMRMPLAACSLLTSEIDQEKADQPPHANSTRVLHNAHDACC